MAEQSIDSALTDRLAPTLTAAEFMREFQRYVEDTAAEFRAITNHIERALGFPSYPDGEAGKLWSYIRHSRTDLERLASRLEEFLNLPRSEIIARGNEHRLKREVAKFTRRGWDASEAESMLRGFLPNN